MGKILCPSTSLAIREAHGDLEKDGASLGEPRPWIWGGREGPTQGAFSEYRPQVCDPKFTGKLPAGKSTHTSLSTRPCLTRRRTNRTGSSLCDIVGTSELSPGCGGQQRIERHPTQHLPGRVRASSHSLMLQMGKLRPRERIELSQGMPVFPRGF